jgi:Winged helix DNA-binding domain
VLVDRFAAQLLVGPRPSDPRVAVERLLAVQAQDPRGARLALRARTFGLTAASIDHHLTVERSLVVTWLNRGTLHLVRAEDYPWLRALTAPTQTTANLRRLAAEGVTLDAAERGAALIHHALGSEGPLVRDQLRARLERAGIPTAGQALVQLLLLASLRGLVVRGPMVGGDQAFVAVRDWLGPQAVAPVDRDQALAELARRYLAGHGPATDRDLAKWAGMSLRDARAGLRAIAPELERAQGLVQLARRNAVASAPRPRLLGAFDPLLLGWQSRARILDDERRVVTTNGIFRPFGLVEGRGVATWGLAGGAVRLVPFAAISPEDLADLVLDAHDVLRYLGIVSPDGVPVLTVDEPGSTV